MLPAEFNEAGDLPEGIHTSSIQEVVARFGVGTDQRRRVTANLIRIYQIAQETGKLDRFLIFGSYITTKPEPNDVDVVLVMTDDFNPMLLPLAERSVFDHQQADQQFGASVFWIRPAMLFEPLAQFVAAWQNKRDRTRRGIVEIRG